MSLARTAAATPRRFLLNVSNDGWFDGTSEHDQHLAICRFRAVECRRSVARAVNMGISAVIDGNGRVTSGPSRAAPASRARTGAAARGGRVARAAAADRVRPNAGGGVGAVQR